MVLQFHFTFKPFPSHVQKTERESERKKELSHKNREIVQSFDRTTRKAELTEIVQSFDCQDRPPRSPRSREAPLRSRSHLRADRDHAKRRSRLREPLIAIARSTAPIAIGAVLRAIAAPRRTQKMFVFLYLTGMFVFLCLFVFLLFGNRENVRKCDRI